ncbi:TonB-dependent receptor plug domain-containing protein [Agitococcus lubricus]|uniref:Outer membrane receptor for ferrienterochelin and colicin n=1 Tax=Agitococcus lubricus TaxID=1077255 RepID=A0A2T5IZA4_9GAMM|nr:TonB-dependent receptor [Agitococcus lubricus]PTQ89349.1 outer membrane receptor for ferrienterochelin and colicin [Agitococcus lubricus]
MKYWPITLSVVLIQPVFAESVLPEVKVNSTLDVQEEQRMASAAKTIIDRKEIEATDSSTVAELLNKLPMTGMFMDAPTGAPPKRGQGGNRAQNRNMPQILVDGQPLGGGNNMGTVMRLPVELIERVEIIRNSTPEFLVTSPAGVINIILRDVPKQLTRNGKVTLFSADNNVGIRADSQYGLSKDPWGYLLSLAVDSKPQVGERQTTINDVTQTQTVIERSTQSGDDNNISFAPRVNIKLANNQQVIISPFVGYNQDSREVNTQRTQSTIAQELDQNEGERLTGRLITEWKQQVEQGGEQSLKLFLQTENEKTDKLTYQLLSAGGQQTNQENTDREEREIAIDARAKRVFLETHLVTAGLEWRQKETTEQQYKDQLLATDSQVEEKRLALWWQDEWLLSEQHNLSYGVRWQQIDNRIDDIQQGLIVQKEDTFAPSIHYLWQPNAQWNVRASIAQHQRPAFARELSPVVRTTSGVNSSSNPDRAGNPLLANETQRSIELGLEHYLADKAGNISLSIFERHISDYVQRLTLLENGRWLERPYNVGDARLRGVSLDSKVQLLALSLPNMSLRAAYAYTQNTLTDPVANLGSGEGDRQSANLGVEYKLNNLTLGASGNYIAAMDRESSATVSQEQGEQKTLNAYAAYKVNKQFNVRVAVNNLLAEDRTDTLYEYDNQGQLTRTEQDIMQTYANIIFSAEGRW